MFPHLSTLPRHQIRARVGLIGFGSIGAQVFERITDDPSIGLDIAFVHNRSPERLVGVPAALHLNDLTFLDRFHADLVVEMAHPVYTQQWGEHILARSSYLPLSVSALADDALRERLLATARDAGTSLAIPHGALMGLDSLREWRHQWSDVVISFLKNPANIDFSESGIDPATITAETVLYDGPARGIARVYPRNINTMITCALATTGLDACRARLVAVPGLQVAIAEVSARGKDGSTLTMRKEQPVSGVSGTEMFASQFASILRAAGVREAMAFV
jgi:predicted dinucleotide-utilizing enzyme